MGIERKPRRRGDPCSPGKVPCPACEGEEALIEEHFGGPFPLLCSICNGEGCIDAPTDVSGGTPIIR